MAGSSMMRSPGTCGCSCGGGGGGAGGIPCGVCSGLLPTTLTVSGTLAHSYAEDNTYFYHALANNGYPPQTWQPAGALFGMGRIIQCAGSGMQCGEYTTLGGFSVDITWNFASPNIFCSPMNMFAYHDSNTGLNGTTGFTVTG